MEKSKIIFLYVGLATGLLISSILAPADASFLPTFSLYWGSQLAVLLFLFLMRPATEVLATMAFFVAITLLVFKLWLITRPRPYTDGFVWLLYLFILFGSAFGVFTKALSDGGYRSGSAVQRISVTVMAALIGSTLAATLGCSTAFYCR